MPFWAWRHQLVLDLCNPKVQDFVFGVVDDLLTKYPDIAYIKWDANMAIMNHGSQYFLQLIRAISTSLIIRDLRRLSTVFVLSIRMW